MTLSDLICWVMVDAIMLWNWYESSDGRIGLAELLLIECDSYDCMTKWFLWVWLIECLWCSEIIILMTLSLYEG